MEPIRSHHGELVQRWRILNSTGLRLKDIEVTNINGKVNYSGVWAPGSGKYALYRYSDWGDFVDKWKELNTQGQRLIDIERVKVGNTHWYYGVWQGGSGKYALYRYSSWGSFVDKWKELNDQGQRLIDIDVSGEGSNLTYIGVWRQGTGKYALYNYNSWDSFLDKWQELGPQGYQMIDMDITKISDSTTKFIGVWKQGSTSRALYRYTNFSAFKKKWAELAKQGKSLLDMEVVERSNGGTMYYGSYGPAPAAARGLPNVQKMAEAIHDELSGQVVGLSYAINHNGQIAIAGSSGKAKRGSNGNVNMSSKIRSTLASVTKNITAVMTMNLLQKKNMSVDAAVGPWLPSGWSKGKGYNGIGSQVTFRHLLTHTSGVNQVWNSLSESEKDKWNNGWDGAKFLVGKGSVAGVLATVQEYELRSAQDSQCSTCQVYRISNWFHW